MGYIALSNVGEKKKINCKLGEGLLMIFSGRFIYVICINNLMRI